MAGISSLGAQSGLDLEGIVNATIEAERVPKVNRLNRQESNLSVELSFIGELKSVMSDFKDAAAKLADVDQYNKNKTTVTQPESGDIISVSSDGDAAPGSFDVEVVNMAKGSRATSSAGAFTDAEQVISSQSGSLTFSAGDKSFTVDIAADATLDDIRKQVNDADDNFGVTFNIINTGSEARLVATSSETGAGNDIEITNTNADFDALSTVANAGGAGGMSIAAEDQSTDALIRVDGIDATSADNTFEDVIQGSTITVEGESQNGETATMRIAEDNSAVRKNIDGFVKAYNNVMGLLGQAGAEGAQFQGDATVRSIENQMRRFLSEEAGGLSMFNAGFGIDDENKLQQENTLTSVSEVAKERFGDFEKLFAGENGLASRIEDYVNTYTSFGGSLQTRTDSLNNRLDRIDDQREQLGQRLDRLETSLRQKYAGLDSLLGQLQSTSNRLDQQLSNLPGFSRNKE
ncbi:MAG TPA: flagellar cap protein [Idiomarina sp.]|uniref:flagellar filament capping protein FliD n=1 Tax=Idiomarina baltica TaxID=190892 RepID=UPI000ED23A83|nr:flagellar filament capping protein FliD [Idiomarina baltica]HAE89411.1 flagellar cap protein [Idiomarina sp.]|tara:strand:- start:1227 stop:2612 length:1386 start_codon:yes stop_codon:yes gene_type:complete